MANTQAAGISSSHLPEDRHPEYALTAKLAQLRALLSMTYGSARESFKDQDEETQDNFLWACSDLSDQCIDLDERNARKMSRIFNEKAVLMSI